MPSPKSPTSARKSAGGMGALRISHAATAITVAAPTKYQARESWARRTTRQNVRPDGLDADVKASKLRSIFVEKAARQRDGDVGGGADVHPFHGGAPGAGRVPGAGGRDGAVDPSPRLPLGLSSGGAHRVPG